jgi:hypothetical protein
VATSATDDVSRLKQQLSYVRADYSVAEQRAARCADLMQSIQQVCVARCCHRFDTDSSLCVCCQQLSESEMQRAAAEARIAALEIELRAMRVHFAGGSDLDSDVTGPCSVCHVWRAG